MRKLLVAALAASLSAGVMAAGDAAAGKGRLRPVLVVMG